LAKVQISRIYRLREELQRRDISNFIVTRLSNIRYLCGYTGSAGFLFITPRKVRFFTDFRYREQAAEQVSNAEIIIYKDDLLKELKRRSFNLKGLIGFEADWMDVATYEQLCYVFSSALEWTPTIKIVECIAAVKETQEVDKIRKAAAITDEVFSEILKLLKPGVRELDISAEISYLHKRKGASGDSFPPIVASGPRSALPHGLASDRKICLDDLVTIDMGCVYDGYCSDLTRTVVVGKAKQKARTIYNLVYRAQSAAIEAAKDGMSAKKLDEVARKIIRDKGYGDRFGHGLGHGLGIEVHAEPRLFFASDDILTAGNVFTIEPGIYIPGFGGVRIEDDIWLRKDDAEMLTNSTRELIEI